MFIALYTLILHLYVNLKQSATIYPIALIITLSLFFGFWILDKIALKKVLSPYKNGIVLAKHKLKFTEAGIETEAENKKSFTGWILVREIIDSKDYIYIMIDKSIGYIVPKRLFSSHSDIDTFLKQINQYKERKQ